MPKSTEDDIGIHRRTLDANACYERHKRWSDVFWRDNAMPKIKVIVGGAIVASVSTFIVVSFFIANAVVDKKTAPLLPRAEHKADIHQIEAKIDRGFDKFGLKIDKLTDAMHDRNSPQ